MSALSLRCTAERYQPGADEPFETRFEIEEEFGYLVCIVDDEHYAGLFTHAPSMHTLLTKAAEIIDSTITNFDPTLATSAGVRLDQLSAAIFDVLDRVRCTLASAKEADHA